MPMWNEYQNTFKSSIADFANVGPHGDCAITAACFLSRFTGRYPWVHLDIAGTATKSGEDKGATGRPVALLAHFLAGRAAAGAATNFEAGAQNQRASVKSMQPIPAHSR
jgi:leucyl aminopeptidase